MTTKTQLQKTKYRTFDRQTGPRELQTFCEVFECSVAYPVPTNRDPYPSSIPLVNCFGATLPEFRCTPGA